MILLIIYLTGIVPTYIIHRYVFMTIDKSWTTMDRGLAIMASLMLSWFSVLLDAATIIIGTYKEKPAKW